MVEVSGLKKLDFSGVLERLEGFEDLDRVNFTPLGSSDIAELDFSGRQLTRASFDEMQLPHFRASHATLVRATFRGANVEYSCFKGADLRGADFSGAIIDFADFSDAQLEGACFDNCLGLGSTNLPEQIRERDQFSDPSWRRFRLMQAVIKWGALSVIAVSLGVGLSNLSPMGPARRELNALGQQVAQTRQKLSDLAGELRDQSTELTAARREEEILQSRIALEEKLLLRLERDANQERENDSPAVGRLSRTEQLDMANSLDQLLTGYPSSVYKWVMYFRMLDDIEKQYGFAGRSAVVQSLVKQDDRPGMAEFLRLSVLVRGPVSPAKIEAVLKERYDHIDKGLEDKQTFWTYKSDWSRYWRQQFINAGLL